MKISKASFIFKKAPFPAIMTIISFVLFMPVYWLVTVKSIEPHYFQGLIFAVPFVCYAITTFFTVIGKLKIVYSSVITGCLIFVLGFAVFFMFIYMAFNEGTTAISDIGKYERVLKLTNYPNNPLTTYFPNEIPVSAKNIVFNYNPAFLQGGENFYLKFKTDSDYIKNYSDEFSKKAKWIGKPMDKETEKNGIYLGAFVIFGYNVLPEDFTIYPIDSKPYHPNDWKHGELSLVAVSKQRNEIIFLAQDW